LELLRQAVATGYKDAAHLKQDQRRRTALELGLRPAQHPGGRPWTAEELALLGTVPDGDLAAQIGRTVLAVRVMRTCRGIPTAVDRRRR
jgi:hypothetical protein